MKKIGVIMGSDSDLKVAEKSIEVLRSLDIPFEVHVLSAHRTPEEAGRFASKARENNFGGIICFAGLAAHLAGAVAANTTLPVIGVPVKAGALNGIDALLSTVQMPPGIPVASVGIDGGKNAAILCAEILSLYDEDLRIRLDKMRQEEKEKVLNKNKIIEETFNR